MGALSEEVLESAISMDEWCEMVGIKAPSKRAEAPGPSTSELRLDQILAKIETLDPRAFEALVQKLFVKLGYPNARTTQISHDGGIDIRASRPVLGGTEHIIVQCKRQPTATVEHARALLGVLESDPSFAKGYLVTSGTVSRECRIFCQSNGRLAIVEGPLVAKYVKDFSIPI